MFPRILFLFSLFCLISIKGFSAGGDNHLAAFDSLSAQFKKDLNEVPITTSQQQLEELKSILPSVPERKCRFVYLEGLMAGAEGDQDRAAVKFDAAQLLAREANDSHTLGHSLLQQGIIFQDRFQDSSVFGYFLEAIQVFEATQDTHGIVSAKYQYATTQHEFGNEQAGDLVLKQAAELAYTSKDWIPFATILNYKGVAYFNQAQYPKSIPYILFSLQVYEALHNTVDQARTLNLLGAAMHRMGETEQALGYLEEGQKLAEEYQYASTEASILTNLAVIYEEAEEWDKALEYNLSALGLYRELDHLDGESACLNNIAIFYESKGQFDLAINYQKEALAVSLKTGDLFGQAISLCNLGEYNRQNGAPEAAIDYYFQSQALAEEIGTDRLNSYVFNGLSLCHKELEQFELALLYKEKYDSTLTAEEAKLAQEEAISEVWAYEEAKKDQKISQLESNVTQKGKRLWIAMGSGALLLFTGLLIGLTYFRRTRQQSAELVELKSKLEHLNAQKQGLEKNISVLQGDLSLKKELLSRQQETGTQPVQASPEFRQQFKEKIKSSTPWPSYMLEFELLYPDFLSKLQQMHEDLTPTDLRLATFLRLSLSSHEIASFLNITPAGVKKARQRIRKKLSLPSETNLNLYLSQIK